LQTSLEYTEDNNYKSYLMICSIFVLSHTKLFVEDSLPTKTLLELIYAHNNTWFMIHTYPTSGNYIVNIFITTLLSP